MELALGGAALKSIEGTKRKKMTPLNQLGGHEARGTL